jgi:hypothetical protein
LSAAGFPSDRFDNMLKLCAEVQTFMTLFISIILRTASSQGGKLECVTPVIKLERRCLYTML